MTFKEIYETKMSEKEAKVKAFEEELLSIIESVPSKEFNKIQNVVTVVKVSADKHLIFFNYIHKGEIIFDEEFELLRYILDDEGEIEDARVVDEVHGIVIYDGNDYYSRMMLYNGMHSEYSIDKRLEAFHLIFKK